VEPLTAMSTLGLDGSMALHLHDAHNAELTCLDCGKSIRFSGPSSEQTARVARTHRCGGAPTSHWADDGNM
jgi:hypothetical protein